MPLEHVDETMRPQPVHAVRGAPHFVCGIAVIRGIPVPVVDVASALGQSTSQSTRFVTLKTAERRVALAVDDVVGVRTINANSISELPPLLSRASAEIVSAIGTLDAELLMVIRSARLVPETAWAAIEAGVTA
jgi:purine-binding chemotaxis protein CheW